MRRHPLAPALAAWAVATIAGLVPPFSRDALNSHLILPRLWRWHGLFWRDTAHPFTGSPPLADLPYLLFADRPWDLAASCWHALGGLFTLLLLDRLLRQLEIAPHLRRWGLFVWITMPTVFSLCGWAYVDLWLCAATAAIACLLTTPMQPRHGWGLGALLAAAVLIKFNGLAVVAAAALGLGWRLAGEPRLLLAITARALLPLSAALLWWYGGNFAHFGTAIYPTLHGGGRIHWPEYRVLAYHEPSWWAALAPLRAFVWGEINNPRLFDGALSPLLLLFPFAGRLRLDRRIGALLIAAICYLAIALTTGVRARYLLPATPFMLPPALLALQRIRPAALQRMLLATALLPPLISISLYLQWLAPWEYWREGRDPFLAHHLADYPIQHWGAAHLPDGARVLLLWMGGRSYYLHRDAIFSMGQLRPPPAAARFDYLLLNTRVAEMTSSNHQRWRRLVRQGCRIAADRDYAIWRLSPCETDHARH